MVSVPTEVIVEREVAKPVVIHAQKNDNNLALALLTEKLVIELQRIQKERYDIKLQLDESVMLTFFAELNTTSTNIEFEKQLRSYTDIVLSKYRKLGGWKTDHEMMLLQTLQEKFANTQLLKNLNE